MKQTHSRNQVDRVIRGMSAEKITEFNVSEFVYVNKPSGSNTPTH